MIDYLVTSFVVLLMGVAFNIYPPSKLHGKYGYRSKAALQSKENWELAQRLSRRYLLTTGVLSVSTTFLLFKYYAGDTTRLFSVIIPIGILFYCIYLIERKLKK